MPEDPDLKEVLSEKIKDPKWKFIFIAILMVSFIYLWSFLDTTGAPRKQHISYSEFIEQLNAGNVYSVTIKELNVRGEFKNNADIYLDTIKQNISVKHFQTFLPSFQGEDILSVLREKGVLINVESQENLSPFWQFIVSLLPWVLIIGIWVLIMRSHSLMSRAWRMQKKS
jgi:cell division protease FtsH